jgi:outer membrane protein assembly factor BamE (lipoprotein component of BamABCDE complex)
LQRRTMKAGWMIAALLCAALAACNPPGTVTAGKEFDYGLAKRQRIVKGVTTQGDIATMFGDPYKTSKSGNGETWEYYSRETGRDEAYADRTLTVEFNERAVVTDFKYHWKETKSQSNTAPGHGKGPPPGDATPCTAPPPPGNPMLPNSVNQRTTGAC